MGALLALENVYEERPDAMVRVLEALEGLPAGHCLDAGTSVRFSETPLDEWVRKTGRFIRQFHMHDNDGTGDQHGPIGSGKIDFAFIRSFNVEDGACALGHPRAA